MNETLFYVFGIALVLSALVVSLIGLRMQSFPPSGAVLGVVVLYFAVMVGGTTTFAVLNAQDEQEHREAEEAAATTETTTGTTAAEEPTQGKATVIDLSADPTQLAFDETKLTATSGEVTVDFDNPSQIGHDVCIRSSDGEELGCSPVITDSKTTLDANLEPGTYTFYCDVAGHEEAGMEGELTVK
jgi:plastocyanin